MHILIVTDQHPDSLGGAQVAIRTQRASLEQLGHRVTIAAPALHRAGYLVADEDREAYIELPSRPITKDREYGLSWPSARTDRALAAALHKLPAVDVVHVQGDFWGAMIGIRAARGLRVPLVFTMHNNVDEGTRAVTPLAPLVFLGLRGWRLLSLGKPRGEVAASAKGSWRYLAELAAEASAVIAPSGHFAAQLERKGVATGVRAVRGGVNDDLVDVPLALPRSPRSRPLLAWLGRMSSEKRVLEFIDAIALADIDADVRLYGAGMLLNQVQERIANHGLTDRVVIVGPVTHEAALAALREADALVQTSVGFETQGLTPFEAAVLGTPTVFCDLAIADDVAVTQSWRVADESVAALAHTLREAVSELNSAPGELRVDESETQAFLQSAQTRRLVEIYQSVLDA
ncbi:glycosyltransferase [Leucobacter sp. UT-8R-CII-1-4]|uniref:glycosyltransferase n=1 Tax=Leucobacter sp. UT-8R-CII-1-4 TaxID=3040075 RepID=UPI0024A8D97A|nr:glycosyltransferase [Leucobacter sp. UT-8R-CII-1-4]MDI6022751.1 glycosyltransferase [Leucobacter sp. UT-8R-CII-1-4]